MSAERLFQTHQNLEPRWNSRTTARTLLLFLGLVVRLFVSVQGQSTNFPEYKVESSDEYLRAVITAVQPELSKEANAFFILARVRNQLGETDEAERLGRLALQADPNRAELKSFLAGLFIHQDRMKEAAQFLQEALAAKPDIPGAYGRLGMVLEHLGDLQGARAAFEKAVQLFPKDGTSRLLLGRYLLDHGQPKDALEHLQRACELDPGLANAFYVLAQAQTQTGDTEAAQKTQSTFQKLKQQERLDLDAKKKGYDDKKVMRVTAAGFHTEVAGQLIRQQRLDLAEAHLRQAICVAPQETQAYEMLATLLLQTGRAADSRVIYEALLRQCPNPEAYRLNYGIILLQQRDFTAAERELKKVLELNPNEDRAMFFLAQYYLGARRNLPEALELGRRLVKQRPVGASYDLLGWASYVNGKTNEAHAAAAMAVQLEPNNAGYRERLKKLDEAGLKPDGHGTNAAPETQSKNN
jgi:tetratricopeptide (TPR) repeat protein